MTYRFYRRTRWGDTDNTAGEDFTLPSVPAAKQRCRKNWDRHVASNPTIKITVELYQRHGPRGDRLELLAKISGRYGDKPQWRKPL